MPRLPPDHSERFALAEEVHARPPVPVETPARASYVALLVDPDERERELAHLAALCARHGVAAPAAGATHISARIGPAQFKWERHGEFSGYTVFAAGAAMQPLAPFVEPAIDNLAPDWLAALPGRTIAAVHAEVRRLDGATPDAASLPALFDGHAVIGADVADGAAMACTDFRVRADGFMRMLLLDRHCSPRQAGRVLQRLFEIEAYRMLALLALPIARRQSPRILAIERALAALTDSIARGDAAADGAAERGDMTHTRSDEALLHELTQLAAEVESGLAASTFRFGACRAYHDLVITRIGELRERRLEGLQTIGEFMSRRFEPAVATCFTVSQRLHGLSERVAQASGLLSTRVDIARERQNQALLASMDRRAKQQLRLQQTVEGLSVAAIAYYAAGLVGYLAKGMKSGGLPVAVDLVVALTIPLVVVLVWLGVRRARKRIARTESAG